MGLEPEDEQNEERPVGRRGRSRKPRVNPREDRGQSAEEEPQEIQREQDEQLEVNLEDMMNYGFDGLQEARLDWEPANPTEMEGEEAPREEEQRAKEVGPLPIENEAQSVPEEEGEPDAVQPPVEEAANQEFKIPAEINPEIFSRLEETFYTSRLPGLWTKIAADTFSRKKARENQEAQGIQAENGEGGDIRPSPQRQKEPEAPVLKIEGADQGQSAENPPEEEKILDVVGVQPEDAPPSQQNEGADQPAANLPEEDGILDVQEVQSEDVPLGQQNEEADQGQQAANPPEEEDIDVVGLQPEDAPLGQQNVVEDDPNVPGPSNRPVRQRIRRAAAKHLDYREPEDITFGPKKWTVFPASKKTTQKKGETREVVGIFNYGFYPHTVVGPVSRTYQVQLAGKDEPEWISEEAIHEKEMLICYQKKHLITPEDEEKKERYKSLEVVGHKEEDGRTYYKFKFLDEEPRWVVENGLEWQWARAAVPGTLFEQLFYYKKKIEERGQIQVPVPAPVIPGDDENPEN